MSHHTTKQSVRFENLSNKAVVATFDQDHASSDAGAVLLKACDEKLKLSTTLASCLSDDRQQSKVTHSLETLFQQRLFAIACGYADGNDAARLADDPVMKLLVGRDPIAGGPLASQPTLSRFENYDTSCYLPLAGFLAFDAEVEQCLFCYVLRAGNVAAKHGATGVLKRLLPRLRRAFPRARLRIRLDAGFCGPELFAFFEAQGLEYVVGMAKNACLTALAEPLMAEVRSDFEAGQQASRRYGECAYSGWELAPPAPGGRQGGSDRPRRSPTERQPTLRGHQSQEHAAARLRGRLLRPGRRGKPAERTQARP